MNNTEHNNHANPEHAFNAEGLKELGEEQSEHLDETRNEHAKAESERSLEQARADVERATHDKESRGHESEKATERPTHEAPKTKKSAYKKTMQEVERHMSPAQRSFSHFIHHPAVEKTSEVVGNTVARPNAILAGSVFAFLFTLTIYVIASKYGYPLSGAETIASFAAGWLIGQIFDYFRVLITGK